MAALSLEMVGRGTPRTFNQNEIRIGTSSECDFVMPVGECPDVRLQHLRICFDAAEWWAEDLSGTSSTLLNGRRFSRQLLSPGDILRLTNGGPELRVHFAAGARVAPTILVRDANEVGPTQSGGRPPAGASESASTATGAQTSTKQTRSVAASKRLTMQPARMPEPAHTSQRPETNLTTSPDEEAMIEQKLNLLRNLLIGAAIVIFLSLVLILSQMQEISAIRRNLTDTRKELADMRLEAHSALGKFYPELDTRLSRLEKNLDGMDQKMHEASDQMGQSLDQKMQQMEDRFVRRMDKETPVIMDRYLKAKQDEMRKEMQKQVIPGH
jgi:hypothetical protein